MDLNDGACGGRGGEMRQEIPTGPTLWQVDLLLVITLVTAHRSILLLSMSPSDLPILDGSPLPPSLSSHIP